MNVHVRESATPGEFLDPPRPDVIVADCSCGAEYEVPQGPDEYGALEDAHRAHVAARPVWRCTECGWEWPLSGTPLLGSECDNCGGELTTEG